MATGHNTPNDDNQKIFSSASISHKKSYRRYLASPEWKRRREERIAFDDNQCRTCCETERLEVHHRHYNSFGNEDIDDLITLCRDCHEAITNSVRGRRYGNDKSVGPVLINSEVTVRRVSNAVETTTVSNNVIVSDDPPQRSTSRPD